MASSPMSSSGMRSGMEDYRPHSDGLFRDDPMVPLQQSQKVVGHFSSLRMLASQISFSSTTCRRGKLSKIAHSCGMLRSKDYGCAPSCTLHEHTVMITCECRIAHIYDLGKFVLHKYYPAVEPLPHTLPSDQQERQYAFATDFLAR
jgi:hypothetical protein